LGQIDGRLRAVVDRNGMITSARRLDPVAGVQFKDITAHVGPRCRVTSATSTHGHMGQLRAIQVFVVGNAQRPGAYTLSSLSTLVNAIFAVGGPSRRAPCVRYSSSAGNSIVSEFDLYDSAALGGQVERRSASPRRRHLLPADRPAHRGLGSVNNAHLRAERRGDVGKLLDLAGGLTTLLRPDARASSASTSARRAPSTNSPSTTTASSSR